MLCRVDQVWKCASALLLLGAVASVGATVSVEASEPAPAEDQLLVRMRVGADGPAILSAEGARRERDLPSLGVSLVRVPRGRRAAVQRRLRASGRFRFVERNHRANAGAIPDDPEFPSQWALHRLQAPAVWDVTRGFGVTIAVVDSGVDGGHADLASRLLPGINTLDGSADTADDNGHGTRMAGVAAARGFDGFGVVGLAPEAALLPIKALDAAGYGSYADVAEGIVEAVDRGARVINLSLGGEVASFTLSSAVDYALQRGVVVVAAAGNSGTGVPNYPAGYAGVVAVGATDTDDQRATFSNYGAWLDVVAPGVDIRTTEVGGGFAHSSGTSPASPLAAATAALVLAVNPSLQPFQVATILSVTSEDVGDPGFDDLHGWGRLDAARAVDHALALAQTPDAAAPALSWLAPEDGAPVEGVIDLAVAASDDVGVARVEYTLDGVVIAVEVDEPFSARWDSATAMPGAHLLGATAYDGSGNQGMASSRTVVVAGDQATCSTAGWTCLPGGGAARTDCFAEWLLRAAAVVGGGSGKAIARCTDGSACDADGAVDGGCTFSVGLCFAVEDERLLDRAGELACGTDDLTGFQLLAPGLRRVGKDPVDAANAESLLLAVAALGTGQAQGQCAAGVRGQACAIDAACDSLPGMRDGVCSLQQTSLAGIGGVESCTAARELRVPLRRSGSKWRKAARVFKAATVGLADSGRNPKDGDALKLECLPSN